MAMRSRIRSSERIGWLALALALAGVAYADEPAKWLERMNHALTTLNYDGTFSHWEGGKVEMLRIIHRVAGRHRLRAAGVPRRLGAGVHPHRRQPRLLSSRQAHVLVERTPAKASLLSGFPAINQQTARFYDIDEVGAHALQSPQYPSHHGDAEGPVPLRLPAVDRRFDSDAAEDAALRRPWKRHRAARVRKSQQSARTSLTRPSAPGSRPTGFQWLRNDSPPLKETVERQ